jgi:small subunit ribosomal protein S5
MTEEVQITDTPVIETETKKGDITEVMVTANRTTKVVKGGRRFGFAVIIVAGNGKGMVGAGLGKAKEVVEARTKASQEARKKMFKVPLKGNRTIPHDVIGHVGSGRVKLRTAKPGTGIIAGGPMRIIFETAGVHDIVAKCLGSSNPHNVIAATFDALHKLRTPRQVAAKRDKADV